MSILLSFKLPTRQSLESLEEGSLDRDSRDQLILVAYVWKIVFIINLYRRVQSIVRSIIIWQAGLRCIREPVTHASVRSQQVTSSMILALVSYLSLPWFSQ